jgi:hypothetical protein
MPGATPVRWGFWWYVGQSGAAAVPLDCAGVGELRGCRAGAEALVQPARNNAANAAASIGAR